MKRYGNLKVTLLVTSLVIACSVSPLSATVSTFEELPLAAESHWNGSDGTGGFQSGSAYFYNNYNQTYGSWDGWAYSSMTDNTTPGYGNQYSAFTGGGADGSSNYGVSYIPLDWMTGSYDPIPSRIDLVGSSNGYPVSGAFITNTTYAALAMRNGEFPAKQFGGATSDDPDWFKLIISGIGSTAAPVEFYLADYRFADNSQDYIVEDWVWVDLSGLGEVTGLEFSVASSDVGDFGINTPTYFAMDELTVVPEPISILLLGLGGLVVSSKKLKVKS
jgi:Domain of unknown function (DUF4465)